jgi:hypothetical protein
MPKKEPSRQFKVGDKIRVNMHHGKIEDAVVRAVVQYEDSLKRGFRTRADGAD